MHICSTRQRWAMLILYHLWEVTAPRFNIGYRWNSCYCFHFLLGETFFFSCDQAALRMAISVCPSVCDTFLTSFPSSYHHEIFRSYYQWPKWCPCERSRSEVKGQGHIGKKIIKFDPDWVFPDCNSSLNTPMATKWCTKLEVAQKRCPIVFQGHPLNFKVTRL